MKQRQPELHQAAAIFLRDQKMRFWQQRQTVGDALATAKEQLKGNMGALRSRRLRVSQGHRKTLWQQGG